MNQIPRPLDIGHHLGGNRWEQLGKVPASTPEDAMAQWIETAGVDPGEYGVRRPGELGWERFVVDEDLVVRRVER